MMAQEKMELDLDMPSILLQGDGHLRRSNSEPMINGLRLSSPSNLNQLNSSSNFPHFDEKKKSYNNIYSE